MTKEDNVTLVGVNIYNHLHRQNNTTIIIIVIKAYSFTF